MAAKIITYLGCEAPPIHGWSDNQFKSPNGDVLTLEPNRPVAINVDAITENEPLKAFYQSVIDKCTEDTEHFKVEDDTAGVVPEAAAVMEASASPGIGEIVMPPPPEPPPPEGDAQSSRRSRRERE